MFVLPSKPARAPNNIVRRDVIRVPIQMNRGIHDLIPTWDEIFSNKDLKRPCVLFPRKNEPNLQRSIFGVTWSDSLAGVSIQYESLITDQIIWELWDRNPIH